MARSWSEKFRDAFRGLWQAVRRERSFAVHLPMAAAVAALAIVLRVSLTETCLLGLCVTIVLSAEVFNTALERLARAAVREKNDDVRDALDMASGAVLVSAIGALSVLAMVATYARSSGLTHAPWVLVVAYMIGFVTLARRGDLGSGLATARQVARRV